MKIKETNIFYTVGVCIGKKPMVKSVIASIARCELNSNMCVRR
jgi:hypothetical protein